MAGKRTVEEAFIRQPSGNEFEPLAPLLEGWFGKPFNELPAELRHLVNKHFLNSWDSLSPRQQHDVASQSDYSRDPAFDFEGGFWFDLTDRRACWERKKNKESKDPHKDPEIHDIRLARIEVELTDLAAEEAEITAGAPTEKRAAMTRIRRQWEERDKNAKRRLAGLSSIESPAQPAAGGELCQPSATAVIVSLGPSTPDSKQHGKADIATDWMRQHVTFPGQSKREAALADCRAETGATYREARAGWNALPDEIRGKRGVRK